MRAFTIAGLVFKEIFRKKDFYVALILMAVILVYASNLNFYNIENITRYMKELGLALIFFFTAILSVPLAARQFPSEIRERTLAVLMAKPVRRHEFVAGKFLGSWAAGMSCFFLYYACFLALVAAKSGAIDVATAVQTAFLFCLGLMVLTALATGLSFYLTPPANVTLTLILYVLMSAYGPALKSKTAFFYYLLPHFEFFDMRQRLVHDLGAVSSPILGILFLYALAYAALFLGLGWAKFKRTVL